MAAALLLPYWAWVTFATALNAAIWAAQLTLRSPGPVRVTPTHAAIERSDRW